jgi:STE24 endopeptidase
MKSLFLVFLLAVSFLATAPESLAQETSPAPTALPAPSIAPGADPATATRAWLDTVPADKKARSDAYFEGGYWLLLWNFLLSIAISLFLLTTGISARLRDFAEKVSGKAMSLFGSGRFRRIMEWLFLNALQVLLYSIPLLLLLNILGFPLHAYENFFREHAYGMATQTFGQWFAEQLVALRVGLILSTFALIVLYFVFRHAPRTWWVWGTVAAVVLSGAALMLFPVYVEPLFNKYTELTDPKIKDPILAMARANQIPVTKVYEVDASRQTKRVSANVSGFLGTTRIALNDNLLNQCTLPEIREVMAHEMGHYVLNHGFKLVLYSGISFLFAFGLARIFFDAAVRRWGARWGLRMPPVLECATPGLGAAAPVEPRGLAYGIADPASLPLFSLILTTIFFVLTPVSNTAVRVTEREADAFSINTAREPDGMAKVALKLGEYRKLDPAPMEEFIFFDHPSGRARIRMAMDWKAAHLPAGGTE